MEKRGNDIMKLETLKEIKRQTKYYALNRMGDNYRANELKQIAKTIINQIGIKSQPNIYLIGEIGCSEDAIYSTVIYGRKCDVIVTYNRFAIFNLAVALYKVHLYEQNKNKGFNCEEIAVRAFGYAVAFCEIKGLNSNCANSTIYIPYVIDDEALSEDIQCVVDEYNVPTVIREYADNFKVEYDMKLGPRYD